MDNSIDRNVKKRVPLAINIDQSINEVEELKDPNTYWNVIIYHSKSIIIIFIIHLIVLTILIAITPSEFTITVEKPNGNLTTYRIHKILIYVFVAFFLVTSFAFSGQTEYDKQVEDLYFDRDRPKPKDGF